MDRSILVVAARETLDHKLLALRAVLVGLASMWVFGALTRFVLQIVWVFAGGGVYLGGHWITLDYRWIRHRMYIAFLLTLLGSAGSGWIVGRFDRNHQTPMVFAFAVSVVLGALLQLLIQVRVVGWTISPLVRYPQTLVLWFALVPISILGGGLMSLRSLAVSCQFHPTGAATTAGPATRDEDS